MGRNGPVTGTRHTGGMSGPHEGTGVLIMRAWVSSETGALRVRLVRVVGRRELPLMTASGRDEACEGVRLWLDELTESGDGPVTVE
jgi:hypothetical protein